MTDRPVPGPIALSGPPSGAEPGWSDRRVGRWVSAFLVLGVVLRVTRFGLAHPLWKDEAFLGANLIERDFRGLMRPLDFGQVCPVLFLWAEKAIGLALGWGERSFRLLPAVASIAALFLFGHLARRLLRGWAPALAVAILAVGFTPIRYGGETKPYSVDFLVATGLIALGVEWLRAPGRVGWLWGLAALGPPALAASNPSVFLVAGLGLALAVPVARTRSPRAIVPFAAFGVGSAATFLALLRAINAPQGEHVMSWMRIYWAGAFPPRSFPALLAWLARAHTSQMFAYPFGGDKGASTPTTALVVVGIVASFRRGSRTALAILLAPFALGMLAAALGRYPYGGSARTMQYVAPAIILLAGLGGATVVDRMRRPAWPDRARRGALIGLAVVGLGMLGWDVSHPYHLPEEAVAREFARRFWGEESAGAELLCARTDLHLPLDRLAWENNRAAVYLCHQAIYSPRHHAGAPPRLDRVGATHPLRVVLFNGVAGDRALVGRWAEEHRDRYRLRATRERVLNAGLRQGKAPAEDRYRVYEFVPAATAGPGGPRAQAPAAPRSVMMGRGDLVPRREPIDVRGAMMTDNASLNRRAFLAASGGVALGASAMIGAAPLRDPGPRRPIVISSGNGLKAIEKAMELLKAGADPLDAAIAGVAIVEADPNDRTVGYGGIPNEEGVVELDAAVMHGPTHGGGAVASVRDIMHPAAVARLVMKRTDHCLLVGEGAKRFARMHGFPEENLLTEDARKIWLHWKETNGKDDDRIPPPDDELDPVVREFFGIRKHGTIHCSALDTHGDLGCVTTTSGLFYKMPGRVGDSPILGAGLFLDNEVGSAGSTGRGEANLLNLSSYAIVEFLRRGMEPKDACLEAARRVVATNKLPRLRTPDGRPNFNVSYYCVTRDGRYGGASIWPGGSFAVHDGDSARKVDCAPLFAEKMPRPAD